MTGTGKDPDMPLAAAPDDAPIPGMPTPRFRIGDRVTGRCVTTYLEYTGTISEISVPGVFTFPGGVRYRLVDTGQTYSSGAPVEPIVDEATCREVGR